MLAILGPGSLGLLLASRLRATGPVTLLARPGTPASDCPYVFRDATGDTPLTLPVQSVDSAPLQELSAVLVSTKATQTETAVAALTSRLPPQVPVLLFQNGMGSQQTVATAYPDRPILAATTTEGANRPDSRTVVHAGDGQTFLGGLTPSGSTQAEAMVRLLRQAGFAAEASDDITGKLWHKLAINAAINPFTAVLNLPNGQLPGHPFFAARVRTLCAEIATVAQREGQSLAAEALEQRVREVCRSTAENISSMLQDVRAERETEIDFINGYLLARAKAHGLEIPLNEALVHDVKAL